MYYLKSEVIGEFCDDIDRGVPARDVPIPPIAADGEPPAPWWDEECDKSLLIGVFKHGYDHYNLMRQDATLCFLTRCGPPDGAALLAEIQDTNDELKLEEDDETETPQKPATPKVSDTKDTIATDVDSKGTDTTKEQGETEETKESETEETKESGTNESEESERKESERKESERKESETNATQEGAKDGETKEETDGESVLVALAESIVEALPFPSRADMNQRLRRLLTAHQRQFRRQEIRMAQQARHQQRLEKLEKFEAQIKERETKKREQAQK